MSKKGMSKWGLTVRRLMTELVKMNPEASVQLQDPDNNRFLCALGKVIYHTKHGGNDPKDADFVALIPDTYDMEAE